MTTGDTRDMNREHEQGLRVLQTLAAELRVHDRAVRQAVPRPRITDDRRSARRELPPLEAIPRQ